MRVHPRQAPDDYLRLISPLPADVTLTARMAGTLDMIHLFTTRRSVLKRELPRMMNRIKQDGMIWISWPKKASKVKTDITEDTIRQECLPLGLVDVKVCAVDETWSGLKLMIRKELRK